MDVTLKNRSPYLMIVALNSGRTLHLAPEETSGPVDDQEVNGNAKVDKLVGVGQLAVAAVEHAQG